MKFFIDTSLLRRHRNFRLLYTGQFVSFFGTMITGVALPFQIYHLTHSTLMVGLLSLAQLLPLLFTALIGGVLADRHHRRLLILYSEFSLLLGCILLIVNAELESITLLFIVSPLMSAINGLHRPSLSSLSQQILAPEDFIAAGVLNGFMYSVGAIAGPALAGLIIAHFGLVATYTVDAATFLISLCTVFMMRDIAAPAKAEHAESTWKSLSQGMKFAGSRQELLGTYFVDFTAMIFGMPNALFPAIAQSLGGVKVLGLMYAAPAIGSLLLSFFSGWLKHIKRYGAAVAVSAILWGVAIIGFGLSKSLWLSLFFLAWAGAFDSASGIFRGTLWNETIPNSFRGRLAGIEMISYLSGPKLGDTEAGLVAAAFGITASVVSGGILCIIGVGVCCYLMPKFWSYRSQH